MSEHTPGVDPMENTCSHGHYPWEGCEKCEADTEEQWAQEKARKALAEGGAPIPLEDALNEPPDACRDGTLELPPERDDETGMPLQRPFTVTCPDCGEKVKVW